MVEMWYDYVSLSTFYV